MNEQNKVEIVEREEASYRVLDKTRKAMRKEKKKILFSKICSITVPILIAILFIAYPVILHNINSSNANKNNWQHLIKQENVRYEDLDKNPSESIKEINDKKSAEFYWLDNIPRIESYILTFHNETILIEEHYLHEDIECVLYISNFNSKINGSNLEISHFPQKIFTDVFCFEYVTFESTTFGKFTNHYEYYFQINTIDISLVETILSNLTNS